MRARCFFWVCIQCNKQTTLHSFNPSLIDEFSLQLFTIYVTLCIHFRHILGVFLVSHVWGEKNPFINLSSILNEISGIFLKQLSHPTWIGQLESLFSQRVIAQVSEQKIGRLQHPHESIFFCIFFPTMINKQLGNNNQSISRNFVASLFGPNLDITILCIYAYVHKFKIKYIFENDMIFFHKPPQF